MDLISQVGFFGKAHTCQTPERALVPPARFRPSLGGAPAAPLTWSTCERLVRNWTEVSLVRPALCSSSVRPQVRASRVGEHWLSGGEDSEAGVGLGADARFRDLNALLAAGMTSGSVQALVFSCVK